MVALRVLLMVVVTAMSLLGPVAAAAEAHGKTPAQVVLRWHTQLGSTPIPKSATPARQVENADLFDFALDPADLAELATLDRGERAARDSDVDEEF